MLALASLLLLVHAGSVLPVLELPEPGLDDTAAYRGYRTRIFRDSGGNPVQIYLERRSGRVVVLWADGLDESAGFTVRDTTGEPATLDWGSPGAQVFSASAPGGRRGVTWTLRLPGEPVALGHVALGSMRWERDLQYQNRHLAPFDSILPPVPELLQLYQRMALLDSTEQRRGLLLLGDTSLASLRAKLRPDARLRVADSVWSVRFEQSSIDGRNHLVLELRGRGRESWVARGRNEVVVRPRAGRPFTLTLSVQTDAATLTPIGRDRIFAADLLAFCSRARRAAPTRARARRLERELRGVELLSYEEKLMAGLPNFATYFGRDMTMTALMMGRCWQPEMLERVIAIALSKLSPAGEVSHEEALGGQAAREHAAEYVALLARADTAGAASRDSLRTAARSVLAHIGRTRESYHMVDESFQLAPVAARYLAAPGIAAEAKRKFLLARARPDAPATRLEALLENFDYVVTRATPYARAPTPTNLVAFREDPGGGWISGSWRDSRAGYAGGRFALDVNVLWVPEALRAVEASLASLAVLRLNVDSALAGFAALRDTASLARARATWAGARRWFEVSLPATQVRERLQAWLAWLPEDERGYWRAVADTVAVPDSLRFLALSLDASGQPILVMNSDLASIVCISDVGASEAARWVEPPRWRPRPRYRRCSRDRSS